VSGFAGVGLWLGSNAVPALWQSWDNWVFDREVHRQPTNFSAYLTDKQREITATVAGWLGFVTTSEQTSLSSNTQSAPLGRNALIGRLTIPRLHLNTTVREGTGEDILTLAAGHMRGTALPGGKGNVAVAGHRDTLFSGLAGIRKNDVIEFETLQGRYEYQVDSTEVVTPEDVSVVKPGAHPELTLITCYPFDYIGPAPDRFIVKARQISAGPAEQGLAYSSPQAPAAKLERTSLLHEASSQKPNPDHSASNQTFFVSKRHSSQLAPGISIGVDDTDADAGAVNGWLWIMPDRRTIWLKDQPAEEPLIFYQNGKRRELMITHVTSTSIAGYLHSDDKAFAR
jgi:sortase A